MSDVRVVVDADAHAVVVESGKAKRAVKGLGDETRRQSASAAAFSAAGRRQTQTLRELGTAARRSTLALGALGAAGLTHLVKTGMDFEKQMSAVNAVTNATAKQFERLKKQALDAGQATAFSAGEAAKAQEELAKGGLSVTNILSGGLNSALALAAAGSLELADAASITANAMNLFGLNGKQSARVADALATAANSTTADVADFGLALAQGGAVAKSAGLSFTETVVALEALAASGIKSSDAGTSLKTALIQLIKPTDTQAELAKKLGLSFVDANGEMKSLTDISAMLRDKLDDQGKAQRTATLATLAGTDGVRTLTALYDAGPAKLERYANGLRKTGAAAEVAKKKQDNVAGAFEQLTGSIETVEAALFSQFQEPLKEALLDATREVNTKGKEVEEFFDRVFDMPEFQAADLGGKLSILLSEFDRTGLPDRMRDMIVEGFTNGLNAAIPIVVEGAKDLAVAGAKAFGSAFVNADPLSRVLLAGYLLHKTGALAAFRTFGKQAGAQTAAGAAVGAGPGGPAAAGWRNTAKSMGKSFGIYAAAAAAIAYGPEFAKSIKGASSGQTPDFDLPKHSQMKALGINFDVLGLFKFGQDLTSGQEKLRDFGEEAERTFKKLKAEGNTRGMAELADQARRMAREFPDAAAALNHFADTADRTAGSASDQFELMRRAAGKSFAGVKQVLADTSFEINQRFGYDTAKAKDALARNFREAAQAIAASMKAGKISVEKGMAEIERLVTASLRSYGLSPSAAKAEFNRQQFETSSGESTGGRARGGLIQVGKAGEVAHDNVPAMLNGKPSIVARGEQVAVFNRHQQAEMNARLADEGGLAGFFARNRRPHYMAQGGIIGRARGGLVTGDTDYGSQMARALNALARASGQSIFVQSGGRTLAEQQALVRQKGLYNASTNPQGAAAPSPNAPHVRGIAADITPGREAFAALAGRFGLGFPVPGEPWHIQLMHALAGGAGGVAGAAAPTAAKLARVLMRGDLGAISALGQRGLDITRAGAQAKLDALAATSGGGSESGGAAAALSGLSGGTSSANQRLGRELMLAMWDAGQWPALKELWQRESGWSHTARNPTSGAFGIPQALPPGKMGAAAVGGDARAQIQWGLNYIKGRYGSPSAALAFHNAHNWYAAGGLIGGAASAAALPRPGNTFGTNRGARQQHRAKPYKPGRYKQRLAGIKELKTFQDLGGKLADQDQLYQNTERIHGLTDEEALRSDAAGNEVRNEGDIQRRVQEIDQLIALKEQSAKWLAAQQKAATVALEKLKDGMRERVERINAIKAAAKANIARIRVLHKRVAEMDRAEGKTKGKAHEAMRRAHKPERQRIARELDKLRDDNERLVGSRSVDVDLDSSSVGGSLGSTRSQLGTWQKERDALAPDAKASVQALFDAGIDIRQLQKERAQWTGTVAPVGAIPKPDDSGLAELLRSQLQDERARSQMLASQFGVFQGFSPLLHARIEGSFARGAAYIPRDMVAQLHEGETVSPNPKGPYGSQVAGMPPANVQVVLTFADNTGQLVRLVDARVDGRAAKVVSEQLGRRQRLIASAPGGRR